MFSTPERSEIVSPSAVNISGMPASSPPEMTAVRNVRVSSSLIGSFGINQGEWAGVPLGSGIVGMVADSGERFVAAEAIVKPFGREENLTVCIPLKLVDRVVGAIGIFRLLQQKEGLEPVDFELFDLLGSHAASALYCTREVS